MEDKSAPFQSDLAEHAEHHLEDPSTKDGAQHVPISQQGRDEQIKWSFTRTAAVLSLCMVYVGAQEILYFTSGGLGYIAIDIHTTSPNWLLTANTLAVTAVCPFVGYITDLMGRRWTSMLGALLLVVASVIMAVAHSFATALVGMTLAGIGAGISELTALAGVAEITPVKWRGRALALVLCTTIPFIPYLIYVQELQQHATWRWGFMIPAVWNFLGLVGLVFYYKPPSRRDPEAPPRTGILKKLDYVGAVLSIAGVTLFLVGLQSGGYQYPWTSAKVLAPLIIGIMLICFFLMWEFTSKTPYPMVPKEVFQGQRIIPLALGMVFLSGMNFYAVLGFFPVMLEAVYATTPMLTGVRGLGYAISLIVGACAVSMLMSYSSGHVREMFTGCSVIMAAFGAALVACTPLNPSFAVAMSTMCGFGIGGVILPALTLALYASPDKYMGTNTALSMSVRFLGGSVGTTIVFNIFNTKIATKLPTYVAQSVASADLSPLRLEKLLAALETGDASAALKIQGMTVNLWGHAQLAMRWAYADSLKYVWYATIPISVICTILALCLPNIRQYMSHRVAVTLH